jgi:DNA-binding PadR family transcriptional regulator
MSRNARKEIDPENLLPLRPSVFHILLALSDGDLHGYGIMQEVAEHTAGQIKLGPGTLYGTIKRLLADRLIVEADERPDPELDDERRRYYCLTDFGQRVLKAEVQRISKMVSVAQRKRLIPKTRS